MASSKKQSKGQKVSNPAVTCKIKELSDVVLSDTGNKIKDSGKWPLLIDLTGTAATFLKYRDANYLCAMNPQEMEPDVIRIALVGAIRYGKPFVLDMLEVDMYDAVERIFENIRPNLLAEVMNKELLKEERYMQLVKASDPGPYQKNDFLHDEVGNFKFIITIKNENPSQKLLDAMYPIRIVM